MKQGNDVCANCTYQDWFTSKCDLSKNYAPDLQRSCDHFVHRLHKNDKK